MTTTGEIKKLDGVLQFDQIDFIKGLCMILVVTQHGGIPINILNLSILAFHMPAFFVVSGFLMAISKPFLKYSFRTYLKKQFSRLVVPTVVFNLVSLLLQFILSITNPAFTPISKIFISTFISGDTPNAISKGYEVVGFPWFISALFLSNIISYIFLKSINRYKENIRKTAEFLAILLAFYLNYLTTLRPNLPTYFTWNIALQALAWVLLGFSLNNVIYRIVIKNNIKYKSAISSFLVFLLIWSVTSNTMWFAMFMNMYGKYLVAMVGAFSGTFAFFLTSSDLFEFINLKGIKLSRSIIWIGKNSLNFYLIHVMITHIIYSFEQIYKFQVSWCIKWAILFSATSLIILGINKLKKYIIT